MVADGLLATGRSALEAGRWAEARAAFEAAVAADETPDALEGLATALWWLGEARASLKCRARAYAGFRRRGDVERAFGAALSAAIGFGSDFGSPAAALGWVARAERLIEGLEIGSLHGWAWATRGYFDEDNASARTLIERALEVARAAGDVDLELVALADLGLKLVRAGQVEDGFRLVDEAMAAALAGEARRLDTVVFTSCDMLEACEVAGDLERATEWCRVADDFIRTYGCPFLYARCRTHYGSVLMANGRLADAEAELSAAVRMTEQVGPRLRSAAMSRMAELRLRQGRLEDAELLLVSCDTRQAALPAAGARLARGDAAGAVVILERHLQRVAERPADAAQALGRLVEANLAAGDLAAASASADRLAALGRATGSERIEAHAAVARARVGAARGSTEDAVSLLEDALGRFVRLEQPYEIPRVHLELARLLRDHQPTLAIAEATAALAGFERVGASADADAAASLLRSLGVRPRTGTRAAGILTQREQEVLRLLALGLSNPEIADRLFISRKTAAHHVSSLLAKLGVRNRTEAVAYAVEGRWDPS